AHSSCLDRMFGDGWIAAGDAAASYDPLSSSGIPRALDSGIHAALAIHDFLKHERTAALNAYDANLKRSFETYLATQSAYYKMEGRWPQALFWRRRQREVTLDPRAIVHSRSHQRGEVPWASLTSDLTPREHALLCELCATPRA